MLLSNILRIYWIKTTLMMADPDSRRVDLNEEFIPARLYKKICDTVNLYPTVDMLASEANRRTKRFVNRGYTNNCDAIAFDVFSVHKAWVENETLFFFPPKNILSQVMFLISTRFMENRVILIFHLWENYPRGFARLVKDERTKLRIWKDAPLAIIPADKVIHFDGKVSRPLEAVLFRLISPWPSRHHDMI